MTVVILNLCCYHAAFSLTFYRGSLRMKALKASGKLFADKGYISDKLTKILFVNDMAI